MASGGGGVGKKLPPRGRTLDIQEMPTIKDANIKAGKFRESEGGNWKETKAMMNSYRFRRKEK